MLYEKVNNKRNYINTKNVKKFTLISFNFINQLYEKYN